MLCLFRSSCKILTNCRNILPLKLPFLISCLMCLISVTCLTRSHTLHTTLTHTHTQGCSAHFSSLMGYQYHQKRCGREFSDDEQPVFLCQHCGKTYRSKAGRDYHVRTEHSPTITTAMTATTNNNNNKDNITDTNNNTGKERVRSRKTVGIIAASLCFTRFYCTIILLCQTAPPGGL